MEAREIPASGAPRGSCFWLFVRERHRPEEHSAVKLLIILPPEVGRAQSRGRATARELGRSVTGSEVTAVHMGPPGSGPRQQPPLPDPKPLLGRPQDGDPPLAHLLLIMTGFALAWLCPSLLLKLGWFV